MNLIEHYVTEVLSKPEFKYGAWWVEVMANSYGHVYKSSVYCRTEQQALAVGVGYKYDA